MANQTGIAIVIKAWLPVSGSISEQIAKLQLVETAHASGDYAELLKAATVEDIKTEQKTRRIEDQPQTQQQETAGEPQTEQAQADTEVPPPLPDDNSHPLSDAIKADRSKDAAKNKAA